MSQQHAQYRNWVPEPFQKASQNLARDALKRFVKDNQVIGLGSGPMAAAIVREMANLENKSTLECISTSFQIRLEAERSGMKVVDQMQIPEIDVVFDGADEVDSDLNMIKGGGGALLREKIVHSCAKKIVITAESKKFVDTFSWPVPIEVHPFSIAAAEKRLQESGGHPKMRMLNEGYPYVTENGNFILDTSFDSFPDVKRMEANLKSIAGVIEVGLFTRHADVYYKANDDGSFEAIES